MSIPSVPTLLLRPALVAIVATACVAGPALAQAPRREGNTWDWRHHEPDPARVRREERQSGLTTPRGAQRQNRQVDKLANKLLRQEGVGAASK